MQRQSANDSKITIPPNLLKNFKVYDVLEPQKNGAKNSDGTKVDKLIDIDECSGDSGFQDSDLNPAFLDKNRDFDLVDLFQNILVSPQHVIKKDPIDFGEFDDRSGASKVDPGFQKFFDMLESGEKIDWTNTMPSKEESVTEHDFLEKKPRVLVPKVFMEPDSDPEDVINEVLSQKNVEKMILSKIGSNLRNDNATESPKGNGSNLRSDRISESLKGNSSNLRNDKTMESPKGNSSVISEDIINELLRTQKNIEKLIRGNISSHISNDNASKSQTQETPVKLKSPEVLPEFSGLNLNGVTKDSKFETGMNENLPPSKFETSSGQNSNPPPPFTVRAIQKDDKVYRKKRVLKPESQTANFNKGPDFYEKTVVLPQIMARLYTRLAYLDEKSNQKRRLILDAGTTACTANVNAQVNSKTNNQTSPSVKDQVKTNPNPYTKNELPKKTPNNANNTGINLSKPGNVKIDATPQMCMNKVTKDIRVHTVNKPCPNCSTPSTSKRGELSPQMLMEDCNKERLKAHKLSQMFKDFVQKGKYDL